MTLRASLPFLALAGVTALLLSGCGSSDGPKLASVSGTVTLDDRPLPDATVEFQPHSGSPSIGVTDSTGRYKLMYTASKPGATLGKHKVRITLSSENPDAQGKQLAIRPLLPPRYNRNSELTAEVTSGSNKFDFSLKSR